MNQVLLSNWQVFIDNHLPALLWGLIILVFLYFILSSFKAVFIRYMELKFIEAPTLKNDHEARMKKEAFERERMWYVLRKTDASLEDNLQQCKLELEQLRKKEQDLSEGFSSLEKEKSEFEKKVLESKIQIYEELIKTIHS